MLINSPGYRYRRGTGSPFDWIPNPDIDLGTNGRGVPCQWCRKCKMSVGVTSEAYNQAQVWSKKHTCKRCGSVTSSAVYYSGQDRTLDFKRLLLEKALAWVKIPTYQLK